MKQNVAILGASDKEERYSNKALKLLKEYGHHPYPIHPSLQKIDGESVYHSLSALKVKIDTLTVYVRSEISFSMKSEILALHPSRVIFNPGSESPELESELIKAGIPVVQGCTLVMLKSRQF